MMVTILVYHDTHTDIITYTCLYIIICVLHVHVITTGSNFFLSSLEDMLIDLRKRGREGGREASM